MGYKDKEYEEWLAKGHTCPGCGEHVDGSEPGVWHEECFELFFNGGK